MKTAIKKKTQKWGKTKDIYKEVTDKMVALLEEGIIPWNQPWKMLGADKNLVSKKAYRGINVFILSCSKFTSPWWMSYKQAKSLGGQVKLGEKGTMITFWKRIIIEDKDTKEKKLIFMLKHYSVFNLEQTEGIDEKKIPSADERTEFDPIEACEAIVNDLPEDMCEITHKGDRAFYRPSEDVVNMPTKESFFTETGYYSTLFHELTHATGAESRLNREGIANFDKFGSEKYSKEELVAEMGAAFLSAHASIEKETLIPSAGYIQTWIRKFKSDPKLLIQAAGQAQKASDYLLGTTFEE